MTEEKTVQLVEFKLELAQLTISIIGTTPMLMHAMSAKAKRELLLPAKKSRADREQTLKHEPRSEFVDALYRRDRGETHIYIPPEQIKETLKTAALRTPGAVKTEIGQALFVLGRRVSLWGCPKLHMAVVKQSGINGAPDIRTRPMIEPWAATFTVQYVKSVLSAEMIGTLTQMAGVVSGIGDWRAQKGKGSYGSFRVCAADDPEFLAVKQSGGYDAQIAAIEAPEIADAETAELLEWYEREVLRRRDAPPPTKKAGKTAPASTQIQ